MAFTRYTIQKIKRLKIEIHYLFIFGLLTLVLLSSCSNSEDIAGGNNLVSLRISTAVLSNGANGFTRSAGELEPGNSDIGNQQGTQDELYIGSLRVLAFDANSKVLKFNRKFSLNPAESNPFSVDGSGIISADLQLFSGEYDFRLIANEETSWNLSALAVETATLSDLSAKTSTNAITTPSELNAKKSAYSGIPMVGAQRFLVPAKANTAATPIVLSMVQLKRTLSKVTLSLSNLQSDGTVYPNAAYYTIQSVQLLNANQQYNMMEGITSGNTNLTNSAEISITHTRGTAYSQDNVLAYYMAERTGVTSPTTNDGTTGNAVTIKITTEKLGGEKVEYYVPIYEKTSATSYDILRNTIYKLKCVLNGTDMPFVEIYYADTDWGLSARRVYMGYGYNVEIEGDKITVSNTIKVCAPHKVTLKAVNGATLSDGATTNTTFDFTDLTPDAKKVYTVNNANIASGTPYLEVYYNDATTPIKTFTK